MKQLKTLISAFALVLAFVLPTQQLLAADMQAGEFKGLSNHVTTGQVEVVKTANGYVIKLADNFNFDGAPDPKVAFGANGKYDSSTLIAPLKSNTGAQTYEVPASIDVSKYNEVYIWCEKFNVGLGVASIK